ncbi:MAG: DUF4861 family protein [Cyclobacteriaceae bacterium]|nr:DUF4861 family protein [Cyclobacteriaceae bacterium HetDA_MAG_MS6]
MKKSSINLIVSAIIFCAFCACGGKKKHIRLENPESFDLVDFPVIISNSQLEIAEGMAALVLNEVGDTVPTQLAGDDLMFLVSIPSGQNVTLDIAATSVKEYPIFTSRTQVYLGHRPGREGYFNPVQELVRDTAHEPQSWPYLYQYEGPGWESELVAFRSYFDSRNGKDIFGKTDKKLLAKSIGLGENYHKLQPWGMDVLKVGSSLGAGALALLKNGKTYRLGPTVEAKFQIIENGPIRSTLRLTYQGWEVAGRSYGLEEEISISANKRWYESSVRLIGGTPQDTLVTGIVNLKGLPLDQFSESGWQVLYTHGDQSENEDGLGMALMIDENTYAGSAEAPSEGEGITSTYLSYMVPSNGQYAFRFYAGWELENEVFATNRGFKEALTAAIQQFNQNIRVIIKK